MRNEEVASTALRNSLEISRVTQRALCQLSDTHDLRPGGDLTFMYDS